MQFNLLEVQIVNILNFYSDIKILPLDLIFYFYKKLKLMNMYNANSILIILFDKLAISKLMKVFITSSKVALVTLKCLTFNSHHVFNDLHCTVTIALFYIYLGFYKNFEFKHVF